MKMLEIWIRFEEKKKHKIVGHHFELFIWNKKYPHCFSLGFCDEEQCVMYVHLLSEVAVVNVVCKNEFCGCCLWRVFAMGMNAWHE